MKFLYKIHSGYDGFAPKRIPERLVDGKLSLGWERYIEDVTVGDEVWVFFYGPHAFNPGVYIEGVVTEVQLEHLRVVIRARKLSTNVPLTDAETSRRVAEAVAVRFRQVFLFPQAWAVAPNCDVNSTATTCSVRQCVNCGTWNALHRIEPQSCGFPVRLGEAYERFAPAFWVIPPRSYFAGSIGPNVKRTSELFYRFKTGEKALAFPLALGMFNALRDRGDIDFECIVPIPLSPAKAARGEIHRTRLLANELARLLGCPMREFLSLNRAISKGSMRGAGATRREFETAYYESLVVDDRIRAHRRVLIVDDVSTEGTTLRCAWRKITDTHPECTLSAGTAGQMVVKAVVLNAASVQV